MEEVAWVSDAIFVVPSAPVFAVSKLTFSKNNNNNKTLNFYLRYAYMQTKYSVIQFSS